MGGNFFFWCVCLGLAGGVGDQLTLCSGSG